MYVGKYTSPVNAMGYTLVQLSDHGHGTDLKQSAQEAAFADVWSCTSNPGVIEDIKFDDVSLFQGDSWMYPYQRTPMGNPLG